VNRRPSGAFIRWRYGERGMKSGYAFIPCPVCKGLTPQTVALLGEEVFVCCHECQTLRMAESEELPDDFDQPEHDRRPLH
jgi:hypothetical protein